MITIHFVALATLTWQQILEKRLYENEWSLWEPVSAEDGSSWETHQLLLSGVFLSGGPLQILSLVIFMKRVNAAMFKQARWQAAVHLECLEPFSSSNTLLRPLMDWNSFSNVHMYRLRVLRFWLKVHAVADHMVPRNRYTTTTRWDVSFILLRVCRSSGREEILDLDGKRWARGGRSSRSCSLGTIPAVHALQTGAPVGLPLHHWSHSSSVTQISQNTSPPSSSASFVYLLCTVATVRADIQWWICVIPFQLLICIESVPPGDINQHVCSSLKECWVLVIVTKLQWWDISHYATGAVFQSK